MRRVASKPKGHHLNHLLPLLLLSTSLARSADATSDCVGDRCERDGTSWHRELLAEENGTCDHTKEYPAGEKLRPVTLQADINDILWVSTEEERDKYVYVLTSAAEELRGGKLWMSTNFGVPSSFDDITSRMPGAAGPEEGEPEGYAGVIRLHVHGQDSSKALVQGAGYRNWVTSDYGASFKIVESPGKTLGYYHQLRLHPTQPDWILAKVRRRECQGFGLYSKWCAFDLFVTQDFGASWANLTENSKGFISSFMDFDWAANLEKSRKKENFTDKTIFATAYESAEVMKGPYPDWDKDQHFVISHDFFVTQHQKVVSCGNQFEIVGTKVYLALPSQCPQFPDGGKRDVCREPIYGSVIMYVSEDEAETFTQACIPVRDFDLSYSMLHTHGGDGSFLMVDHDEEEWIPSAAPISNVYAAGEGNAIFTLSLPRAYRRNGMVDFSRVEGVPGVFLANQLSVEALESYLYDFERWITTKISLNGGANWQDLKPPQHFRHASCDRCSKMSDPSKCKLHLHGPASYHGGPGSRPSFYSHYNAPGVVIAVGNTGEFLDIAADEACTWMSSNAGVTWHDVAPKPHIYEFGDAGGVTVIGSYATQEPADRIHFSLDHGACWHSILFSEAIDIRNIRVEPSAASRVFMVHGHACTKRPSHPTCSHDKERDAPAGKLYTIDVAAVMGDDFKVCGKSDYGQWAPPTPGECLLGRRYVLHRRKPTAACFNEEGWAPPQNISSTCRCQPEDVECEFGYERVGDECVEIPGISAEQCPALKQKKYVMSSTHTRLIQDNVCDELDHVIPDTDGRGGTDSGSSGGRRWITWVLVGTGVVAAAFGAYVCYVRYGGSSGDSSFKESLIEAAMAASEGVGNAFTSLKERLTGKQQQSKEGHWEPLAGGGDEFEMHLSEEDARSPPLFDGR